MIFLGVAMQDIRASCDPVAYVSGTGRMTASAAITKRSAANHASPILSQRLHITHGGNSDEQKVVKGQAVCHRVCMPVMDQ